MTVSDAVMLPDCVVLDVTSLSVYTLTVMDALSDSEKTWA